MSVLVVGDWGQDNAGQYACATGMGTVADALRPEMVLSAGDNLYGGGVQPSDGPDGAKRFNRTFERVYDAPSLASVPWYAVSGNSDWNIHCTGAYSRPVASHRVRTLYISAQARRCRTQTARARSRCRAAT